MSFEKTSTRLRWRRSRLVKDRVLLAIIAFLVAMALILISAYLRSDVANDLPALSAGYGVTMQESSARVGVRAPGNPAPAVESILRADLRWTASWCALGGTGALQRLATTVATKPQAGPRCLLSNFPGVTVVSSGAGVSCARESNTAFSVLAHAAPGNLSTFPQPDSSAVETDRDGLFPVMCVKEIESVGQTAVRSGADSVSGTQIHKNGSARALPPPAGAVRPLGLFQTGRSHA